MVYRSGRSKHHQCISLLQKPTGASPPQKQNSVMLSGHTEVEREGGYPCVCKAVKRGAEEAASLAAKSALLFPCETSSVEDVCAAHLHTEMAFGKRMALSRLET
ncbi:hypothetical protein ATANTOWER_031189 [Ataeniobius toweri]|uniref:Uncharacterized protein n=1 Tax=Ataeniobius toweri TaxID=208326 RepID=A0ABU7C4X2_9TELE|nr:hypothetical protein [Ataeniobius toweri]